VGRAAAAKASAGSRVNAGPLAVFGAINVDLVVQGAALPRAGETTIAEAFPDQEPAPLPNGRSGFGRKKAEPAPPATNAAAATPIKNHNPPKKTPAMTMGIAMKAVRTRVRNMGGSPACYIINRKDNPEHHII